MLQKAYTKLCLALLTLVCFTKAHAEVSFPICWHGLYVSGQLGGSWNNSDLTFTNANYFNTLGEDLVGSNFHFEPSGFVGGGAIGYNYQCQCLVIGIEAGTLYTKLEKSKESPFFPTLDDYKYGVDWTALAKARVGYAIGRFLPFITGGWAGNHFDLKLEDITADIRGYSKKWANGWTVGGGCDYKIIANLSVGIAYDYIEIKDKNHTINCSNCGSGIGFGTPIVNDHIQTHIVTARINLHL
jgi:outer membrane immunogenic protein